MTDERYTAEGFLKAIGKPYDSWPRGETPVDGLFHPESSMVTDTHALGLALEWLRGQTHDDSIMTRVLPELYRHLAEYSDLNYMTSGTTGAFMGVAFWMFECPRPGAALAKAIIDAETK
jgi:hypothetical protein